MVVKILSSAGTFSGVEYNENKVSLGSAEPLAAVNFGLLNLNGDAIGRAISEYQQYFKVWSTNERGIIDKPQFHAVISCEGREYSGAQLKDIAEQYLEKMGYKENPYLIYFHKDTANNHVHLVSSRVDQYGLKINDSFERLRSQVAMKEILGQDIGQEVGDQVKKALAYNFSSDAQFKMILEGKGITVKAKDSHYQFIKAGCVAYKINKTLVDEKIKNYHDPRERAQQLKAIFVKYKPVLDSEKFSAFMQNKFGVDVLFHTAKGKDTPYGYSVIDHSKRQVFKGTQVMPLSALLSLAPREEMLKAGGELITTLAEIEKLRFREFKSQLGKFGFELSASGEVKFKSETKASFTISKERIRQILYNDRLFEAQKFTVANAAEAKVIRRLMFLKREDNALLSHQVPGVAQNQAKIILSEKLNSLLASGKELENIAQENNYGFAKSRDTFFLIDKKAHAIYNIADLTTQKLDYSNAKVIDVDRASRLENNRQMEYSTGTFGELSGLLLNILESNSEEKEQEITRRKRKRNA